MKDLLAKIKSLKDMLRNVTDLPDNVLPVLRDIEDQGITVIDSLKKYSNESANRKDDIERLQAKFDDQEKEFNEKKTAFDLKEQEFGEYKTGIVKKQRDSLITQLTKLKDHEKYSNTQKYLKTDVTKDTTDISKVVEGMSDTDVLHDIGKLEEYSSTGLFTDVVAPNSDQGGTGAGGKGDLSKRIQGAKSLEALDQINKEFGNS